MSKKYLVYNPEKGNLNLNDGEHILIGELGNCHPSKYETIIESYLTSTSNKNLAVARLDEILTVYYQTKLPDITPFTFNLEAIDSLFEIIKKLRNIDEKNQNLASSMEQVFGENFSTCVSALQNCKIINDKNHYCLGNREKSVFAVWWDLCRGNSKVVQHPTLRELSKLIEKEFKVKISVATLSGTNSATANSKYKTSLSKYLK